MDEPRTSFAESAAKFSLVAPVLCLLVVVTLSVLPDSGDLRKLIGWINLSVVALGFLLGILALAKVSRGNASRVVARAIVGVLLNGLALAAVVWYWSLLGGKG